MRLVLTRVINSHISNCDSTITEYHNRKVKEIGKGKAVVASARKFLAMIYSILKTQKRFKPNVSNAA